MGRANDRSRAPRPGPAGGTSTPSPRLGHNVVLGGAGFLGTHLCRRLLRDGASQVTCIDSLVTGSLRNVREHAGASAFRFIHGDGADVLRNQYLGDDVAAVWNLAALASPVWYFNRPLETAWAGAEVHRAAMEFAVARGARFLFTGTSETYGDPQVHPQPESYWGNVNPCGPRACYDESKRYGEMLTSVFFRQYGLDARIARLFNTYGPTMALDDGRMIPAFLAAAIRGVAMPLHGDGSQTRSLIYVDDMIEGLVRLMDVDEDKLPDPPVVNLGNPHETTVREVAERCWAAIHGAGIEPALVVTKRHPDDPNRRCPDIGRAKELLGWEPEVKLEEGLKRTAEWFRGRMRL